MTAQTERSCGYDFYKSFDYEENSQRVQKDGELSIAKIEQDQDAQEHPYHAGGHEKSPHGF
ncbi:hypothetical protein QLQ11_20680 [Ochrobactrum sp. SSR]|uniref:hypothetical protein n=1 Tax=Ochrobactrum sp. SSR TaxID=3045176 RepID=UPI0027994F84|nr:hypothetical protein QLQ11_20680 [Ochrobactrum sp. SSR]